jgi:hypothetical protein
VSPRPGDVQSSHEPRRRPESTASPGRSSTSVATPDAAPSLASWSWSLHAKSLICDGSMRCALITFPGGHAISMNTVS